MFLFTLNNLCLSILFFSSLVINVFGSPCRDAWTRSISDDCDELQILESKLALGASLSYKQTSICETTCGVKAFSGYLHLPSSLLAGFEGATTYNLSVFFWYFESRNDPRNAPLALYLGGGPGTTSLGGVTFENGPCFINPDSNSTSLNPWSWNNHVNMLYIDQPAQVGFSYDQLINSTLDVLSGKITPVDGPLDSLQTNGTFLKGTLPSQNPNAAANTTANVARTLWHFTQTWLADFPEHNSSDDRISVWTNSYGGHYGPAVMAHFGDMNNKIKNGTIRGAEARFLHLDTLGITNGCIDGKTEGPFWPEMAFNNTYGLQAITENIYHEALNMTKPGGCHELTDICRALAVASDPQNTGTNATVNAACATASQYCFQFVQGAYVAFSGSNAFDISRQTLSIFPPHYIIGFMNQEWVRKDLGVPLNFTISYNNIVDTFFGVTGDALKVGMDAINFVAGNGIKIALIYGDRDYRCNWLGGEAVSLAMEYPSSSAFRSAGYESITINTSYTGGVVRQHDKVSFSRVFDGGHSIGAFQPETVSKIFDRVMFDKDVAAGNVSTAANGTYSSKGPESSFGIKNKPPKSPEHECYLLDPNVTCTEEERAALADGTAVVKNFILTSIAA